MTDEPKLRNSFIALFEGSGGLGTILHIASTAAKGFRVGTLTHSVPLHFQACILPSTFELLFFT